MARRRRKTTTDPHPIFVVFVLAAGIGVTIQNEQWIVVVLLACLLLVILTGMLITIMRRLWREKRLRESNIVEVDAMSGVEFEEFIRLKLIERGYTNVRLTKTYDLGIDIVACKGGDVWGIQTKRYKKPVGLDAVRQVSTALSHYGCTRGMVITNSYFTANARTIAASVGCMLVDRDRLISLLLQGPVNSPVSMEELNSDARV